MSATRRIMAWLAALSTMAVLPMLAGCSDSDNDSHETRSTRYGLVDGNDDSANSGTWNWKGIPFAKAPVGDLRWRAPVEPEPWTGVRAAKEFGAACVQNGRIYGPGANNRYDATIGTTLNTPVGSEDCLSLNIWRPANLDRKLPVIFFVYGGSNISGYTADPVYDGANLARVANAIVVTANYRVGVFGFFDLPQLKTGVDANADSGNFALLDIVQALKFVQANIEEFGGDAGNVTLMGQSAGAINTWALLASPLADGLFHRAIPISGGISLASNLPAGSIPTLQPAAVYEAQGNALLYNLLVADGKAGDLASAQAYASGRSPQEIADYMRSKDAATILGTVLAKGLTGSGPIPDGKVLPLDPIASLEAGNYRKVPILAGNTADEGKLFAAFFALFGGPPGYIVDDATRFDMMMNYAPNSQPTLTDADIINPAYLPVDAPKTGYNAVAQVLTDVFMVPSRDDALNAVRSQQSNVWFYQFDWKQEPAPWNDVYGAAHAFDLGFIFGNFGPSLFSNATNSEANRPGRLALSEAMMQSVAAFARSGDPNNAALGMNWPAWPAQLHFDATLAERTISVR